MGWEGKKEETDGRPSKSCGKSSSTEIEGGAAKVTVRIAAFFSSLQEILIQRSPSSLPVIKWNDRNRVPDPQVGWFRKNGC